METIEVSLPTPLKEFLESESADRGYESPGDYICALIRKELDRKEKEKIDEMLLAGLRSGPATPMTAQDWDDIRAAVKNRHE